MKNNQSSELVDSLIRAAQPEMSRIKDAADLGFDTRLRCALGDQSSPHWSAWEAAARNGLRIAFGVTALVVLQAGFWIASQERNAVLQTEWILEQVFLGI
jgi:hypothetical protein